MKCEHPVMSRTAARLAEELREDLGYLLLGTRTSELAGVLARDVDDGGRVLWIRGTKSGAARRRLAVPEELAGMLLELAAGLPRDAPLFRGAGGKRWPAGRPMTRHMAYGVVRRACLAAGVPVLSPQGLRRTQSTLAIDAGVAALEVSRHLGHATGAVPAVTGRAYVSRDAARAARVDRGLRVLQGGQR